ncbi:hypothetical protein D3C78_1993830 [compost metagenome]
MDERDQPEGHIGGPGREVTDGLGDRIHDHFLMFCRVLRTLRFVGHGFLNEDG